MYFDCFLIITGDDRACSEQISRLSEGVTVSGTGGAAQAEEGLGSHSAGGPHPPAGDQHPRAQDSTVRNIYSKAVCVLYTAILYVIIFIRLCCLCRFHKVFEIILDFNMRSAFHEWRANARALKRQEIALLDLSDRCATTTKRQFFKVWMKNYRTTHAFKKTLRR